MSCEHFKKTTERKRSHAVSDGEGPWLSEFGGVGMVCWQVSTESRQAVDVGKVFRREHRDAN